MLLERPMTRQFCESRVMNEYHTRKPYFMNNGSDDMAYSHSSTPGEELWKKFELFLTPPSSPLRDNSSNMDEQAPQLVPVGADSSQSSPDIIHELECMDFDTSLTSEVVGVTDLSNVIFADLDLRECSPEKKIIKDCMWNGVGHKASSALRKAHNRTYSPPSDSSCHPNGCVDPRKIFPYPVGLSTTAEKKKSHNTNSSPQKYYKSSIDGAETPSDSEEEIDVVTVEKVGSAILPSRNTASKIVAAFVPKEKGKLAIVTNNSTGLTTKGVVRTIAQTGESARGRSKNKIHVFTAPTTTSSSQQSSRSIATTIGDGVASDSTKKALHRRHTVGDSSGIMAMANPKMVMQRGGDSSPSARFQKKRILSLEGVSFCATTKVNRSCSSKDVHVMDVGNNSEENDCKVTTKTHAITPIEIKEETEPVGLPHNKRKRKADAIAKLLPPGTGSDSEQIRAAHNVLERQRREGLRTSFHTLRDNVPELQNQDKAPKVHILNKARDYCIELQKTEENLMIEKERETTKNERLKKMLQMVRKSVQLQQQDGPDSEIEDCTDSPLTQSLPPSPQIFPAGGYYIARRVSQDNSSSSQEVVLRLEPTVNPQRKRSSDYVSALKHSNNAMRAYITPISKCQDLASTRGSLSPPGALSDGFECLSEEEAPLL